MKNLIEIIEKPSEPDDFIDLKFNNENTKKDESLSLMFNHDNGSKTQVFFNEADNENLYLSLVKTVEYFKEHIIKETQNEH